MRVKIKLGRFLPFAMMEALEMRKHFDANFIPIDPVVVSPIDSDDPPPPDSVQMNYDGSVSELATPATRVTGTWARFTGPLTADQYTATIDWGDGSTSAGTIVPQKDGSFAVVADHDFGAKGQFEISVEVDAADGSSGSDWHEVFTQADPITFTSNADLWDRSADDGDIYVANFVDVQPGAVGDYAATVSWGDGAQSPAEIIDNGDGSYSVVGQHAYAATGQFAVSVTVQKGVESESTTGTATIDDTPILWTIAGDGDATDPIATVDGSDDGGSIHPIFRLPSPIFVSERGASHPSADTVTNPFSPPPPPNSSAAPVQQPSAAYDLAGDVDPKHLLT